MNCLTCGKPTRNPKFCSNSCAATYNNRRFPKRKREGQACISCGKPASARRKYCEDCAPSIMRWMSKRLGDLESDGYDQTHRIVRVLARRVFEESDKPLCCAKCGYAAYVEICHIRSVRNFAKRTEIAEVNRLSNLVALCPTHHWELDNGLLDVSALGET